MKLRTVWTLLGALALVMPCTAGPLDCTSRDIDESGLVDIADLLVLLVEFGNGPSVADFNGDGDVTINDLLLLLARSNYGYLGQDDPILHFGLGSEIRVDVEVTFLDGTVMTALNVAVNQTITLDASQDDR